MNALLFIFSWYNLPFTFLLAVCVLLAALQLIGLGGQHEGDAGAQTEIGHDVGVDHDVDLSHDLDVSHDVDLGHDLDVSHDVDVSHDLDVSHDADLGHDLDAGHDLGHDLDHDLGHDLGHEVVPGAGHEAGLPAVHGVSHEGGLSFLSALAFLGVGKAPLMVVLLILFGSMGLLGWLLNAFTVTLFGGGYPALAFGGVLLVVLVLGGVISSRTTLLIARALPPFVTTASRAEALVGRTGMVISPVVDEHYGQVHLRDPGGTLITVFAVTRAEAPIPRGEQVVTVSYEADQKRYLVTRSRQVIAAQRDTT